MLKDARAIAAYESSQTTRLYDRTGDRITLDEIEWIRFLGGRRLESRAKRTQCEAVGLFELIEVYHYTTVITRTPVGRTVEGSN